MEFSATQGGSDDGGGESKSLETLLLEKNKSLQGDNTRLKNSNTELTGMYADEFHLRQLFCMAVVVPSSVAVSPPHSPWLV